MLELVTPAPFFASRDMLLASMRQVKPLHGRMAAMQLARAHTCGFLLDGELLALIGFYPVAPCVEEVFLWGRDQAAVGPHMLRLSRLAELTIRARAHSGVLALRAVVRLGHRPGERLARLAGFGPLGPADAPDGFTVFVRRLEQPGPDHG